jgi:hypothetical protein
MHYLLEVSGDTATLYLDGKLGSESVSTLLDVCGSLPAQIRTLRLDLRAIGTMSAEAIGAVRLLLRQWRENRPGEFRLSTSHLLATCSQTEPPHPSAARASASSTGSDALTAIYV